MREQTEKEFIENKSVGNSAENIVWALISSMTDWECIQFGVENHIKDLRNVVINHINPITKKIKSMPDFVAFNKKTGETLFLEVKFRSKFINFNTNQPEYHINFLEEYKEYWAGTKLIICQNYDPYISVVDLDKIGDSMCRKEKGKGAFWDFGDLKCDIKKLFSDLKEEDLEKAKKILSRK